MRYLEVFQYATEMACLTRTTTLIRVGELLSETLLEEKARILSNMTLTVACSSNAGAMIGLLQNSEPKIF